MALLKVPDMSSNLATTENNADSMVDGILNDPNAARNSAKLLDLQEYISAFHTMVLIKTNDINAKTQSARKIVGNIN